MAGAQLLSPQALLCHGQAEAAEGAGTSMVPASITPLGTEQSEFHTGTENTTRSKPSRVEAELVLPGCPGHCCPWSHLLCRDPCGAALLELIAGSALGGHAMAPCPLLAEILRKGRFQVIINRISNR